MLLTPAIEQQGIGEYSRCREKHIIDRSDLNCILVSHIVDSCTRAVLNVSSACWERSVSVIDMDSVLCSNSSSEW